MERETETSGAGETHRDKWSGRDSQRQVERERHTETNGAAGTQTSVAGELLRQTDTQIKGGENECSYIYKERQVETRHAKEDTHTHTHTHARTHARTHTHTHTRTHARSARTRTRACTRARAQTHTHTYAKFTP